MSWFEAVVRWYAVLAAVTWALAPGVAWLCARLDDRGVTVARPLAVLAALYPAWLLASLGLTSFNAELVAATVVLAGLVAWILAIRTTRRTAALARFVRHLALAELASALLFVGYVWLRGFTPQILGTEKPMDIAFLASSSRTAVIPPLDPWFSGEPINYYYLGYLLHGTIGRLAGVPPEIAFNLALATIFSTTAVATFGVAWNVVRPQFGRNLAAASGLFAGFFVAVSGNLYAPWRLIQDASATVSAGWWDSLVGIGWRSSRIVCDGLRVANRCQPPGTETINEFPIFSLLLGDLHPHVMALPYSVVAIALAVNLWRGSATRVGGPSRDWWFRVGVTGAVVGALYPLNAWDFPTFLLLVVVAMVAGAGNDLRVAWKPAALAIATSLIAWWPYIRTYDPPTMQDVAMLPAFVDRLPLLPTLLSAVALHPGERTSVAEYLTIFGVPYGFGVALVVSSAMRDQSEFEAQTVRTLAIAVAATVIPGVMLSAPLIPLCGIPLALACSQLTRLEVASPRAFALLLFAFAWALSIAVEIVYIRDVFDDRMNTLFKFYYQTWTLYAIAAATTIAVLWAAFTSSAWRRALVAIAAMAAVAAGLVYPVVASYHWTDRFASWRGLDGLVFAQETEPDGVAAIRWLARNARPGDVVLEAAGCSYLPFDRLPFNRISAYSGVPTIIGWANHERQWRGGQPVSIAGIETRQTDVAAMYGDPESPLFDVYGVEWLVVGAYEAGDWSSECDTAGPYLGITAPGFPGSGWQEAFASGDTRIFRRAE